MKIFFTLTLTFCCLSLFGQDPTRFAEEVNKFRNTADEYPVENRIVFTGSSSIRLWTDFKDYFPNHNVINTGFGGSETTDLLFYKDILISQYQPKQVFIYEGDNDINEGKPLLYILNNMVSLIFALQYVGIEDIVIISPKPSIARWGLKAQYEKLNTALATIASLEEGVQFADIWTPMLNNDGSLKQDLFLEDDLHMNKKGYDIWIKVLEPLLIK